MNKSRLLWVLVALDVLLAFGSVGAQAFFGWTLPPVLQEFAHERFARWPGAFRIALLGACVALAFTSWIGLASFWRHARRLYLASLAVYLLFVLISGPVVLASVSAMVRVVHGLVAGMILGLVYFSDLARRFEQPAIPGAAPAGVNLGAGRA